MDPKYDIEILNPYTKFSCRIWGRVEEPTISLDGDSSEGLPSYLLDQTGLVPLGVMLNRVLLNHFHKLFQADGFAQIFARASLQTMLPITRHGMAWALRVMMGTD